MKRVNVSVRENEREKYKRNEKMIVIEIKRETDWETLRHIKPKTVETNRETNRKIEKLAEG